MGYIWTVSKVIVGKGDYIQGTPGNFLGENTVNGSVNTCANTVELSDRTYEAPGSGAGGLRPVSGKEIDGTKERHTPPR